MTATTIRRLSKEQIAAYMASLKTDFLSGAITQDQFDAGRQMVRAEVMRRM